MNTKSLRNLMFLTFFASFSTNQIWASEQYLAVLERNQLVVSDDLNTFVLPCHVAHEVVDGALFTCETEDGQAEVSVRFDERKGAAWVRIDSWRNGRRHLFRCEVSRARPMRVECEGVSRARPERAGLVSPFESVIDGLDIPNARQILGGIYRAMRPQLTSDYEQMAALGIGLVIIFKVVHNRNRAEVEAEQAELSESGVNYSHIDFPYTEFDAYYGQGEGEIGACKSTLKALRQVIQAENNGVPSLIHCTVGEDRTGYLDGLLTLLRNPQSLDPKLVFKDRMCEFGYGAGNPNKPIDVVEDIRDHLTPLYQKMAAKIKQGQLSWNSLPDRVCESLVRHEGQLPINPYQCETSTRFYP